MGYYGGNGGGGNNNVPQQNSDWNAQNGVTEILNKPFVAIVPFIPVPVVEVAIVEDRPFILLSFNECENMDFLNYNPQFVEFRYKSRQDSKKTRTGDDLKIPSHWAHTKNFDASMDGRRQRQTEWDLDISHLNRFYTEMHGNTPLYIYKDYKNYFTEAQYPEGMDIRNKCFCVLPLPFAYKN